MDLAREGIEKQAVDREVATLGILAGRAEGDPGGVPAVGIRRVGAEGRHLDLPRRPLPGGRPGPEHCDHPEGGPDGEGPPLPEHISHNLWRGGCGHVVVCGRTAQKLVPDTAASPVGFVPGIPQSGYHGASKLATGDRVDQKGRHEGCLAVDGKD